MKKKRHNYTAEEKVFILKQHFVEKIAISDLCDKYQLQPKAFYTWQKQFFENVASAFIRKEITCKQKEQKLIDHLEDKLRRKHEVLSELMEEHIKLKKALGVL